MTRRHLRSVSPEDPYQLDDPSHDPNAFYTYAGKDSTTHHTRLPTEYLEIIAALVARREIPEYQTPADFIRDAIHHRIYWYQNHYDRPEIGDQINVFTQIERSKERQRAMAARKQAVVQFRAEFLEAQMARSRGACQAVLDDVVLALDSRDAVDDTYKKDLEGLRREMVEGMRGMG